MRTPVKDIVRHSLQEPVIRDQTRHYTSDSQSCLFRVKSQNRSSKEINANYHRVPTSRDNVSYTRPCNVRLICNVSSYSLKEFARELTHG